MLPEDKLLKCRILLQEALARKTTTLRNFQSLLGHLNFACKVVVPVRAFLRWLYALTHKARKPEDDQRSEGGPGLTLCQSTMAGPSSCWILFTRRERSNCTLTCPNPSDTVRFIYIPGCPFANYKAHIVQDAMRTLREGGQPIQNCSVKGPVSHHVPSLSSCGRSNV